MNKSDVIIDSVTLSEEEWDYIDALALGAEGNGLSHDENLVDIAKEFSTSRNCVKEF